MRGDLANLANLFCSIYLTQGDAFAPRCSTVGNYRPGNSSVSSIKTDLQQKFILVLGMILKAIPIYCHVAAKYLEQSTAYTSLRCPSTGGISGINTSFPLFTFPKHDLIPLRLSDFKHISQNLEYESSILRRRKKRNSIYTENNNHTIQ